MDLHDFPPEAGPVNELHVWIGIRTGGREAMLSADFPMLADKRHAPLMSSRRALAEKLGVLAHEIQRQTMQSPDPIVRVELRTFRAVATGGPNDAAGLPAL